MYTKSILAIENITSYRKESTTTTNHKMLTLKNTTDNFMKKCKPIQTTLENNYIVQKSITDTLLETDMARKLIKI